MKNLKITEYAMVLIFSMFVGVGRCETANAQDIRKSIKFVAYSDWVLGDEERKQVNFLREHSDELFPVFIEIINESEDDKVISSTLSFAYEAVSTRREEITAVVVRILKAESPSFTGRRETVSRALEILGNVGDGRHIELVQKFVVLEDINSRAAAKEALTKLKQRSAELLQSKAPNFDALPQDAVIPAPPNVGSSASATRISNTPNEQLALKPLPNVSPAFPSHWAWMLGGGAIIGFLIVMVARRKS